MAPGKFNFASAADTFDQTGRFAELSAPLDALLRAGGDERLALVGRSGLNIYGCKPAPRPEANCFSSSTASSISGAAYLRARAAQEKLVEQASVDGSPESFASQIEQARHTLRSCLGLEESGAEIIFAPSGTDAQLLAVLLAQLIVGTPVTSVVVGADQTGSGTAYTAIARHFGTRTARGRSVWKGEAVAPGAREIEKIDVPFSDESGVFRPADEMDRCVWQAVGDAIAGGSKVILLAMNASKFGWRAPSDECLARISANWPGEVQIVLDACQMRIGRARLRRHLANDHIVLITGSKFFSGPPFSGGLLVPKRLSHRLAQAQRLPRGVFDYAERSDLPAAWPALSDGLAQAPNFGQWLRWEAALEEMRAYFALALSYRRKVLAGLAQALPRAIGRSGRLLSLPMPQGHCGESALDEEFASPTIFPFVIRSTHGFLEADAMSEIYRDLNRDISAELRCDATPDRSIFAARICHVGQPVKINLAGSATAALRIAIGSRNLCDAWQPGPNAAERAVNRIMDEVSSVLGKLELILKNREHAPSAMHRDPH